MPSLKVYWFLKSSTVTIFQMIQAVEGNYKWSIPLIVSNFITILLMFFFTKDHSQQEIARSC